MTEFPDPWTGDRPVKTFVVLVVPVSGEVDPALTAGVIAAFEHHEFTAFEAILGSVERVQELCDEVAANFDAIVTVGGLRFDGSVDIADVLRVEIEEEIPGVCELLRRAQFEAGYHLSVFENAVCGRIDGTVIVTLPDAASALEASADLLASVCAELLGQLATQPSDGLRFDGAPAGRSHVDADGVGAGGSGQVTGGVSASSRESSGRSGALRNGSRSSGSGLGGSPVDILSKSGRGIGGRTGAAAGARTPSQDPDEEATVVPMWGSRPRGAGKNSRGNGSAPTRPGNDSSDTGPRHHPAFPRSGDTESDDTSGRE